MTTFTVTTSADAGAGSLRAAVSAANASTGADVIAFDAAVFDGGSEDLIRLTSGQIEITDGLTITGGPSGVTITGDADGDDVTLAGGITDVDASLEGVDRLDDNSRIFDAMADLTLDGLTLTGGRTTADFESGGAVRGTTVTVTNSTISGNSTAGNGSGGGGIISSYGVITLTNSTLSGNSTAGEDSGGGGVLSFGSVTLTNSTVSENSTVGDDSDGGGVYGYRVTLSNSTVSENSTVGQDSDGGGIFSGATQTRGAGDVMLTDSTVSGNSTAGDGSGGGGVYGDEVTLTNSIVLGNVTIFAGLGGDEVEGAVTRTGGNILGGDLFVDDDDAGDVTATEVFAATTEIAPGVHAGVLADNGGSTRTIAILANGPAAGAADEASATAIDQRGLVRDAAPDLGAFEADTTEPQEPQSLIVTTALDVFADDGLTSLREAVAFANVRRGADTIAFDTGVFDGGGDDLIRLTKGEIGITEELTIFAGPTGVTITGDRAGNDEVDADGITDVAASGATRLEDNRRIFDATAALTLDGLTLTGGRTTGAFQEGGAVRGTTLTLIDSTVSGNSTAGAESSGGGVYGRLDVTLTNTTVSGNSTAGDISGGGGVYGGNVALTNSMVSGNSTAGDISGGGGISGRDVALTNSTVSGNSTAGDDSDGGGVSGGNVTLTNSTVSGNGTAGNYSGGGGVVNFGDITVTNSTVSGNNTAGIYSGGGGVYAGFGDVTVKNSTISGNSTTGNASAGGGIAGFRNVTLTNSILLGNATISAGAEGDEIIGAVTRTGGNIVGGDLFDGDADVDDVTAAEVFFATTEITPGVLAGVLADNGGPTQTIAISGDGPAAGAADPTTATATDQRDVAREAAPDLGAFEAPTTPGLVLVGGPEGDDLTGGFLADEIYGLGGDDVIEAGGGDDRAYGGSGRDQINGGVGDDVLGGGADPDRFVVGANFGADVIIDFDADPDGGQDKIDLQSLGITAEDFATALVLEERGEDLLIDVEGGGTVLLLGLGAEGAAALDQSDFLFYETTTFTVTTTADDGAGSLRQAILDANALAGQDLIVFDAGVFDGGPEDLIRLTSGQIEITDELTIVGGLTDVTVTGDAAGDDVTLAGGITDIRASGAQRLDDNSRIFAATADVTIDGLTLTGGHISGTGGAMTSSAAVTLQDSTISGNGTSYASSGYLNDDDGGGVHTSGALSVQDSTISGNYAYGSGGGLSGETVHITNSVISENRTGFEQAGGGVLGLHITVENSTVSSNSAGQGGGIHTSSTTNPGSLRVINSVVSENTADYGGGGIRAFYDIYVSDSIVSGNDGGGYNGEGGGIHGSAVTVVRSTVSDNTGSGAGGGIYSNSVRLENSTVSGNTVTDSIGANGGGVFSFGAATVIQSTVSGNFVDAGYFGGGGGGIMAGSASLENSIVLGNATGTTADEVQGAIVLTGGNILGPDFLDGDADVGDVTAAEVFSATTEIAPGVFAGTLADNDGPTPTIAIRADGPAAGAADPATSLATDQRGVARDDAPDLGAFEAGAAGGLKLVGGPGADVLTGGAGDDRICGRGGNDLLQGLAGDDLLRGGKGCDILKGGDGEDVVFGDKGDDRIGGGAGDDMLYGGRGHDVFVFAPDLGADTIVGFDANPWRGQDRMDLRGLGISAASFASEVMIEQINDDTLITLQGQGSVLCRGIDGEGGAVIDQSDFLLLA